MKAEKTLLPGEPGTKKLVKQYGEDLVCVRYRYDAERNLTIKTVELVVDRRPRRKHPQYIPKNKRMPLRVEYGEVEIGRRIRAAGGTWNREEQVWKLAYHKVLELGLHDRLIPEGGEEES
jgi:hypothetical protein